MEGYHPLYSAHSTQPVMQLMQLVLARNDKNDQIYCSVSFQHSGRPSSNTARFFGVFCTSLAASLRQNKEMTVMACFYEDKET